MDYSHDGAQGVFGRAYKICPALQYHMEYEGNNPLALVQVCQNCEHYFALCCQHGHTEMKNKGIPCHHHQLIFVDGGCPGNGTPSALAGMGVLYGKDPNKHGMSVPMSKVSQYIDIDASYLTRTNQAAELVAAILALNYYMREGRGITVGEQVRSAITDIQRGRLADIDSGSSKLIIATDSVYLVKGMTEWLPKWKRNGYKNSLGQPLANKELFLKLDSLCKNLKTKYNVDVGFWHIPRAYNSDADKLAKNAARQDVIPPPAAAQQHYALSAWNL